MKTLVALAVAAATVTAFTSPARGTILRADKTTWDSVYTESQAARGDTLYKATCAKCHGATLTGGDEGGPLVGRDFAASWNGMTLDQLFEKIRTTMPPDNPKTVPPKDVADIVAYLLAQNKFPAGASALTEDVELMKTIKFASSRP
jgi:mono/diheme cytochrome c family protein